MPRPGPRLLAALALAAAGDPKQRYGRGGARVTRKQAPPPPPRLRGAGVELGDVQQELAALEKVEHRVENDLTDVLRAVARGNGSDDFEAALGARLLEMREDLRALVKTINATRAELAEARDAVGSTEKALASARGAERRARLADRLREGRVAVDYESGEVAALHELLSREERKRLAAQIGSTNRSALEAHLLRESYLPAHGSRRFAREKSRVDPAKLHLDARFLQDVVALSLATAVGGLCAALLALPSTLGYMLGGVLVGPSGLNLIHNLEQAETVAQFGSIFLLFSHGLMYSHYLDERKKKRQPASRRPSSPGRVADRALLRRGRPSSPSPDDDDDVEGGGAAQGLELGTAQRAFTVGLLLVACLGLAFAVSVPYALGGDHSSAERSLVAAAFALSSSSTVFNTLHEARLEETLFGNTVVELLSVQDLVLAPLLALPTAVHELRERDVRRRRAGGSLAGWAAGVAGGYVGALALVVLVARRVLPRILGALQTMEAPGGEDGPASPGAKASLDPAAAAASSRHAARAAASAAFGLCVVGYALAMALLGDRLKLSHEAGALFAGLILVGTQHVDRAKKAVAPLAALFGGMYVASLGLVVSPRYLQTHFAPVCAHVVFVVMIKVAVVAPLVYALGFSRAAACGAGAVFAQVSEVALFVTARAHELELVARHTYLDVLSTTIVLLAVAPLFGPLLRRVDRRQFLQLEERRDDRSLFADAATLPLHMARMLGVALLALNPQRLWRRGRRA